MQEKVELSGGRSGMKKKPEVKKKYRRSLTVSQDARWTLTEPATNQSCWVHTPYRGLVLSGPCLSNCITSAPQKPLLALFWSADLLCSGGLGCVKKSLLGAARRVVAVSHLQRGLLRTELPILDPRQPAGCLSEWSIIPASHSSHVSAPMVRLKM